jgi:D-amino peptidase
MVTGIPGVRQIAERQVTFELPTMREAIRCFRVVTQIASASIEKTYG